MTEDTGSKARPERHGIGSFAPHVPFLTAGDTTDRGPAGSLVQARARERALRLADRPPAARDWRLWLAAILAVLAVLAVVALALLSASGPALAHARLAGPFLLLLAGLAAAGAAAALCARYRVSELEADLSRQIDRERRAARQLDTLRGLGWTVLHDRLVPGTEHRVAHVLAGPAGLIAATVLPVTGPVRLRGNALVTGDQPLAEWFATRWWEAERINAAMGERLPDWPWNGPIYPVALYPDDATAPARLLRSWRRRTPTKTAATKATKTSPPAFPLVHAGIAIRETARVRQWATAMPAPLGRLAAARLASELEAACPPAARHDAPQTGKRAGP